MATGNTGGPAGQTQGLPSTAPVGALGTNSNGTFVVVGTDNSGAPVWSSDPTAISAAQAKAALNNSASSGTPGVTSTLGGPPTPPPQVDASGSSATQTAAAQSAHDSTVAALGEQENSALATTKQSQAGETAGYAETAATLSSIGGLSTLWTGFFSNLNDSHQTALASLKAQYDSAIASADTGLANQIIQIQQNTLSFQAQQQQQFFDNAMTVFNAAANLVNTQVSQKQAQSGIDLQTKQLSDTEAQQKQANATNALNTSITAFQGAGWNTLTADQQSQLTSQATAAGLPAGAIQGIVNKQQVAQLVPNYGDGGNYTAMLDSSGKVIGTLYTPQVGTVTAQTLQSSLVSTPFGNYIDGTTLSGKDLVTATNFASGAGGKVLKGPELTSAINISSSLSYIDLIKGAADATFPADWESLVSGYAGRTVANTLKNDGGKIASFQSTWKDALAHIQSTIAAGGSGSQGRAMGTILKSIQDDEDINPQTATIGQLNTMLNGLQSQLIAAGKSLMGTTSSSSSSTDTASSTAATASATDFLSGLGIGGSTTATSF